jgi:hypothetical protein
MAIWNKGLNGAGPFLLIGVAGMLLGPPLLRLVGRATRPVARTAVRSGVGAYERTRDGLGGLIEESRAELEGSRERREHAGEHPGERPKAGRTAGPEHGAKA